MSAQDPDRVQPRLENRQDNQSHSGFAKVWTSNGDTPSSGGEPALCHITRRRTRAADSGSQGSQLGTAGFRL